MIGGAAAFVGARQGAKWAADEQRKHAESIAADRRRDELQSRVLTDLDEQLMQLENRARAAEEQWVSTPNSMASNWNEGLTRYLHQLRVDWPAFRLRVRGQGVLEAIDQFDMKAMIAEVDAAQVQRNSGQDQASIDQARAVNRKVFEETGRLIQVLNDAM